MDKRQTSVSIPKWVWIKAEEHFERNKEALQYKNIKSTTKLITIWILQNLENNTDPKKCLRCGKILKPDDYGYDKSICFKCIYELLENHMNPDK